MRYKPFERLMQPLAALLLAGPLAANQAPQNEVSLAEKVEAAIGLEPLGTCSIHVVVKGGRVTLFGRVDNGVDRERAEAVTRGVHGVMGVENRIEVIQRTPGA